MDRAEAVAQARDNYDRMAEVYWDHVSQEAAVPSIGLAALQFFANAVQRSGPGLVADVGCGPGHITSMLAGLGLDVYGVDISAKLLEIATKNYPDIRFEAGELAALPIETDSLHGVVAKHSLIHTPVELVPEVLREFARVLAPGGRLYLSFFAAAQASTHGEGFDHAVTTAYQFDTEAVASMLADAGFAEEVRIVRQPKPSERQLPSAIFQMRLPR